MDKVVLGSFLVMSGELVVSDPCYSDMGGSINGTLKPAKKGRWNAVTYLHNNDDGWGTRNAFLVVAHKDHGELLQLEPMLLYLQGERADFVVGVDSGQAGIFDTNHYRDSDDPEEWYRRTCDVTIEGKHAGVIEGGAVSSSGYGDGAYCCSYVKKNEAVVAIVIEFGVIDFGDAEETNEEEIEG